MAAVDGADTRPIVIDMGSGVTKCGRAGTDEPAMFPTVVGTPKSHVPIMGGMGSMPDYVGDEAMTRSKRLNLDMKFPVNRGVVTRWNELETLLSHIIMAEMRVDGNEQPLFLTDPPFTPRQQREKLAQILFECWGVPALYIHTQGTLSVFAAGCTTGIAVEVGDGVTQIVPVLEGNAIPHAIQRLDLGGCDITDYMTKIIRSPQPLDRQRVTGIKETLGYVAQDFDSEMRESSAVAPSPIAMQYTLPDGQSVTVAEERFRGPECLFQPEVLLEKPLVGIHVACHTAITKCDQDIQESMFSNVILSGGSLFPGIIGRMHKELTKLAPATRQMQVTIKPVANKAAWVGGSILASLSKFQDMWLTSSQYDESGPSIALYHIRYRSMDFDDTIPQLLVTGLPRDVTSTEVRQVFETDPEISVRVAELPKKQRAASRQQRGSQTSTAAAAVDAEGESLKISSTLVYQRGDISYDESRDRISHGAFGQVYRAKLYKSTPVAVKVIAVKSDNIDAITREARNLVTIIHPAMVQFIGVCVEEPKVYIIMEQMECDLHTIIYSRKVTYNQKLQMAQEMAGGITYMHIKLGMAHCDLKPENFLVTSSLHLKVSDFGFSRLITGGAPSKGDGGTPIYLSPELWNGKSASTASDTYAIGLTLWQLFSEQTLFQTMAENEIYQKVVVEGERPKIPSNNSAGHLCS
ncbi:actin, cytoplasmic 2 [Pelomyxa schiedti]|nr:actin, cytoplasmic 2 [Pelomyxa schiedti]